MQTICIIEESSVIFKALMLIGIRIMSRTVKLVKTYFFKCDDLFHIDSVIIYYW